jgi:HSP20 family molecular chaperone IbpA
LTITCTEVSVIDDEKDEGLEVTVELPGVSKEDLGFVGCFQLVHEVNSDETKAKSEN